MNKQEKELDQELGIISITDDLKGMKITLNKEEVIIPMSMGDARVVIKGENGEVIYEETPEIYKHRRKIRKHHAKGIKKARAFWTGDMGTYVNNNEAEIREKYEKVTGAATDEIAGQELEKIANERKKK